MSNPLSYSIKTAAADTGLSETRIKQAIHSGELKARRSATDENGDPAGKYVILRGDLESFVAGLVAA